MQKQGAFPRGNSGKNAPQDESYAHLLANLNVSRKLVAGIILLVALVAFEMFNFDTTRFALENLLGEVNFAGLRWATILAVAFCAIDFAGLARLFTPERGRREPTAVWYLMGAWLIAATMNAMMTWWAVSVTLLGHDFGNEVLSREQLLRWVPFFVATLVWLTRILFIGAFSVAGDYIFDMRELRRFQSRPTADEKTVQPLNSHTPLPHSHSETTDQTSKKPTTVPRRSRSGPPRPAARPALSARPSSTDGRSSRPNSGSGTSPTRPQRPR